MKMSIEQLIELSLDSERPRGQCSFIRTNNKLYVSYIVKEARACLRSKEIRSTRQAKQLPRSEPNSGRRNPGK